MGETGGRGGFLGKWLGGWEKDWWEGGYSGWPELTGVSARARVCATVVDEPPFGTGVGERLSVQLDCRAPAR